MVDPLLALAVFGAALLVVAAVSWPRHGLIARMAKAARFKERVLVEDALKHVYTCESVGRDCTIESLAGQLEISTGRAASLLARLAELDLIRSGGTGPSLTDGGRETALRLIRSHRLWERYLADRTGVPAGEWHARAEQMEHALTAEETEVLSARLGHPSRDPHGDPIPTAGGDLPAVERLSLAAVTPGAAVEIVHLEDEPREVYDALLEDGLGLGARLHVVERTPRFVQVHMGGRDWSIAAVVARNVTVRLLPPGTSPDRRLLTLRDLSVGETGLVVDISPACQGTQRRRLLDLGVVKGTEVTPELVSAGGDPVGYRLRGALIALRGEQAGWIRVERAPDDEKAGVP